MNKEDVIKFLEEKVDERLQKLADEHDMSLGEIKDIYADDPEEIYDWDDGDNFLQSVDTVLYVLED